MTDPYKSIDEMINQIRLDADGKVKTADEAKFAAEVKATFLEDQLNKAVAARAAAERITMALLTQFSTVEKVFAEAKEMALKVDADQKADADLANKVHAYNAATNASQEVPAAPSSPIDTLHADLQAAKEAMNAPEVPQ